MNKIIRSICGFPQSDKSVLASFQEIEAAASKLESCGYEIQTLRICSKANIDVSFDTKRHLFFSKGTLKFDELREDSQEFVLGQYSANVDLTHGEIDMQHVDFLFALMEKPESMFRFCYSFSPVEDSPYFPASNSQREGFSVGLQSPNLSQGLSSQSEWHQEMLGSWEEICELFTDNTAFLGIDASVAPMGEGAGSFIAAMEKFHECSFKDLVVSDVWTQTSNFIKEQNPRPVGLCGLMFPCLEDQRLAELYEAGEFSLERNVFLSLHSGLGIDTYPIGIDQDRATVLRVLRLIQALSKKYQKPLSIRFVSDGKSKIGQKSEFHNEFLQDVVIRSL